MVQAVESKRTNAFTASSPTSMLLQHPNINGARATSRRTHSRKGKNATMTARKLTRQDVRDAAEKFKNWGKWGPDDEIGTLNYTSPEDIIAAAKLVKKGKVISLALNFDHAGPQGAKSKYPALGRT